jgi:ribosome maturation factor RimP
MRINTIIEQAVNGLGYELVDVEITPTKTIRVFIDKDGGVTIEDCGQVSDHLGKLLIVEEIDYNRLEISSPGLDRPLKKFADFIRFVGKDVKIKTTNAVNNEKVFYGTIANVDEANQDINLKLDLSNKKSSDETILTINFNNINKARLVFEYKKSPKHKPVKNPAT